MRRLSSIFKPRLRPWIALGAVAFVVAVMAVIWQDVRHRGEVPWMLLAVSLPLLSGLFAHVRNAFATNMADEAWIDDDNLQLRRAEQLIRMPLTNIGAVKAGRESLITLELCMPCALGNRIRFIAPPHMGREIAAELRRRIDESRRHPA